MGHAVRGLLLTATLATATLAAAARLAAQELVVSPAGPFTSLAAAVEAATPGATIRVQAGEYREPTVEVRVPRLTITGEGWPRFDGEGVRELLVIRADDVTVRGLAFTNTGVSHMQDRAALRVIDSARCLIDGNRFTSSLFAIYLQRADGCEVRGNDITGDGSEESVNGNGVHLWYSPRTRVVDNRIRGQRDGIYFEFSRGSEATGNVSEDNRRYGLHFMFSDSCRYERNTFRANGAGVAVMYSKAVEMHGNGFLDARGSAAYALLLKDITDGAISGNRFAGSSTGLYLEGSSRLEIADNDFHGNGWAVRLMANAEDNRFTGNTFSSNAFDVATNSRTLRSTFSGNWWDAYRGYDLDRDGAGDVPFHPVRLFALVVERHPEALLLLRSPVTAVLDAAERVFPVLTPALADPRPLMRRPR
jgi:nitrous oxidase accessory protein